jgi:hypothetical protein
MIPDDIIFIDNIELCAACEERIRDMEIALTAFQSALADSRPARTLFPESSGGVTSRMTVKGYRPVLHVP